MSAQRAPILDETAFLLAKGYAWLPDLRRRAPGPLARTRLFGRHTVGMCGPEAVRFLYDEGRVRRGGAAPEPIVSTLFGHGSVHGLDGERHRLRKEVFSATARPPDAVASLTGSVASAWDEAAATWPERSPVVLFHEAAGAIAAGVARWAGVPLSSEDEDRLAADLVALVDGFATLGPRHWRARIARAEWEGRLSRLVDQVRSGSAGVPEGSVVDTVARHRENGEELPSRVAAVEILNVLRPTTAACWLVAFAAHAFTLWPEQKARVREGEEEARSFAQEVRRFYPFAPFVGGVVRADTEWKGERIPEGALVLLDIYGQLHSHELWKDPYVFDPTRFTGPPIADDVFIPQGGGDVAKGHRCPGEDVVLSVLTALCARLAELEYTLPAQDWTIPLGRVPTRPRDGAVVAVAGSHGGTGAGS
ncbi:cytochrome P450 [Nocardiopsis suaedae]|uniref:Cytochrome P450 n=1 Tax=Nocardiopsis suaedae TaxID=3018444 RepID=A0ABT4TFL1_9ACTN|nr:cytochrome P450 [Nocardiopsis suaedae]MDA2803411.1 cytochrome P450 [Nocardiopsis suaedae]